MKTEDEIQKAHDTLHAILDGDVPVRMRPQDRLVMQHCADVLCWVLNHKENDDFGMRLARVYSQLELAGYEIAPIDGHSTL